jgi:hypothetical protein
MGFEGVLRGELFPANLAVLRDGRRRALFFLRLDLGDFLVKHWLRHGREPRDFAAQVEPMKLSLVMRPLLLKILKEQLACQAAMLSHSDLRHVSSLSNKPQKKN